MLQFVVRLKCNREMFLLLSALSFFKSTTSCLLLQFFSVQVGICLLEIAYIEGVCFLLWLETWVLFSDSEKKGSRFVKTSAGGNFSASSTWNTRLTTRRWARSSGTREPILAAVRRRKLAWIGNVTRRDASPWRVVTEDPELLPRASSREDWMRVSAESSLMSSRPPNRSRDWTELN